MFLPLGRSIDALAHAAVVLASILTIVGAPADTDHVTTFTMPLAEIA